MSIRVKVTLSFRCHQNHRCAVCGTLCLPAPHATRGFEPTKRFARLLAAVVGRNCPSNFAVRCRACKLTEKKADPDLYRHWWELSDEECITEKFVDRRKIVYEIS